MNLFEAIEEITGQIKRKVSYTDAALALGVTRQYANQIKDKILTEENILKLEQYFEVSLANASQIMGNENDCVIVEQVHISPSCGKGTYVCGNAEITPVKLGLQMIKEILNVSKPENLKIFKASGDSMSPSIEDGDVLLVDTGRVNCNNGGIFLITIDNEWFIKRLRLKINGMLEIISENVNKYGEPELVSPNDDVEIVLKGRVIKNLSRGL